MTMETTPPAIPAHGIAGWAIRVRAPFFTATLVPVALGAAVTWVQAGIFAPFPLFIAMLAAVLVQAGANLINDYFDYLNGTDRLNQEAIAPYTGGGPFLRLGLITPRRARNEALGYFAAALVLGMILAIRSGSPWLVLVAGIGIAAGLFYTAPQVFLVGAGWGEFFIFLSFGPLLVLWAWTVQMGTLSWEPVWASLPVGFLITNVIWINQFPDAPADAAVGKRHWVVRLGRARARYGFGGLFLAAYVALAVEIGFGVLPVWTGLGLLTLPLAWRAWRVAWANYDRMPGLAPANALAIQIHLFTGLLMTLGYLVAGIVS